MWERSYGHEGGTRYVGALLLVPNAVKLRLSIYNTGSGRSGSRLLTGLPYNLRQEDEHCSGCPNPGPEGVTARTGSFKRDPGKRSRKAQAGST